MLIKCHECGKAISAKAKACPSCGAPLRRKSRPILFLSAVLVVSLFALSYCEDKNRPLPKDDAAVATPAKEPVPPEKKGELDGDDKYPPLDFSRPIVTRKVNIICPISLMLIDDPREGHGFDGVVKLFTSVFGREEKMARLGCEEWRGGLRVRAKLDESSGMILLSTGDEPDYMHFTIKYHLKNTDQ